VLELVSLSVGLELVLLGEVDDDSVLLELELGLVLESVESLVEVLLVLGEVVLLLLVLGVVLEKVESVVDVLELGVVEDVVELELGLVLVEP
jgi:hypothetical protein